MADEFQGSWCKVWRPLWKYRDAFPRLSNPLCASDLLAHKSYERVVTGPVRFHMACDSALRGEGCTSKMTTNTNVL